MCELPFAPLHVCLVVLKLIDVVRFSVSRLSKVSLDRPEGGRPEGAVWTRPDSLLEWDGEAMDWPKQCSMRRRRTLPISCLVSFLPRIREENNAVTSSQESYCWLSLRSFTEKLQKVFALISHAEMQQNAVCVSWPLISDERSPHAAGRTAKPSRSSVPLYFFFFFLKTQITLQHLFCKDWFLHHIFERGACSRQTEHLAA